VVPGFRNAVGTWNRRFFYFSIKKNRNWRLFLKPRHLNYLPNRATHVRSCRVGSLRWFPARCYGPSGSVINRQCSFVFPGFGLLSCFASSPFLFLPCSCLRSFLFSTAVLLTVCLAFSAVAAATKAVVSTYPASLYGRSIQYYHHA
jgi:hypothetical protein